MSLRSPLARARGLGSAKEGVALWWFQRLTAVALLPLVLWFCLSLAALPSADHASVLAWLATPLNTVLLIAIIIVTYYHGYLGLQVVVEDYVPSHAWRTVLIVLAAFAAFLLATGGVFAVLRVALGSAA